MGLGSSRAEEAEVAVERVRLGAVSGYISEVAITVEEEIATRTQTEKSVVIKDQARLVLSLHAL